MDYNLSACWVGRLVHYHKVIIYYFLLLLLLSFDIPYVLKLWLERKIL